MTHAELKAAEAELADILPAERLYFGFLMAFVRRYPDSDDIVKLTLRYVGVPEAELDRKTAAFLVLARTPRLAA